jgi:hypothetical protein
MMLLKVPKRTQEVIENVAMMRSIHKHKPLCLHMVNKTQTPKPKRGLLQQVLLKRKGGFLDW